MYLHARGIDIAVASAIFLLYFGTVQSVWYFFSILY